MKVRLVLEGRSLFAWSPSSLSCSASLTKDVSDQVISRLLDDFSLMVKILLLNCGWLSGVETLGTEMTRILLGEVQSLDAQWTGMTQLFAFGFLVLLIPGTLLTTRSLELNST